MITLMRHVYLFYRIAYVALGATLSAIAPLSAVAQSTSYPNPFNVGGVPINTVPDLLFKLVDAFLLILAPIAVVMIVYGGFLFVAAQGNENRLEVARRTILWSVIGLVLILGTKVLSSAIQATICELSGSTPSWITCI
jgi:hypothetical protein